MGDAQHVPTADCPAEQDLSLSDASVLYGVPLRTLRDRVRRGAVPAHKVRGLRGREWRVSVRDLEAVGLRRRSDGAGAPSDLQAAEIVRLRRLVDAERRRADRADRELGHALLESGRLRTALAVSRAAATRDQQPDDGTAASTDLVSARARRPSS